MDSSPDVIRIKSDRLRTELASLLRHLRSGGIVIVEHYNDPIAIMLPYLGDLSTDD
jgi:antitoxin (DNA-binding transcriptional repressor) of toxin-antitoxin stability system